MSRICVQEMNRRRLSILGHILQHSDVATGEATLSYSELGRVLNLTNSSVRQTIRWLATRGLISVRERHLPNGGSLENAYALTHAGKRFLLEARRAQSRLSKA